MCDTLTFYKALSEPTRLISLLLLSQHGELCVCDLMTALALSQPKISRHLAELRKHQLVVGERRGKWVYYQLHPALPDWMRDILLTTVKHNPAMLPPVEPMAFSQTCCEEKQ
ncbi:metalloregulator ArsR/SmtB family transcription factor [Salinivibrio proteolyticus]|uniref:Metalloregulator ArsR/SmtB family transcription factor n=1 Tax=Salinivibrio proteolyticus TaxID=334715 RepID=A0ABY7LGC1_9GAMM|nr:metalloregulator ArsR/SmtB family transcription factor [Salinivibrio proteolyticus]WBA15554.1 metalloregulator ArsR/SmtB family transcription factor [Salinivibrio proteolyticus]